MSIHYCEQCQRHIDTDQDVEHFYECDEEFKEQARGALKELDIPEDEAERLIEDFTAFDYYDLQTM